MKFSLQYYESALLYQVRIGTKPYNHTYSIRFSFTCHSSTLEILFHRMVVRVTKEVESVCRTFSMKRTSL